MGRSESSSAAPITWMARRSICPAFPIVREVMDERQVNHAVGSDRNGGQAVG